MKTVGILSGISYVSGLDYYKGINIALGSKPRSELSYETVPHSSKAIMVSLDLDDYATRLRKANEEGNLDRVGVWIANQTSVLARCADFIVIASNTGHIAVPYIQEKFPDVQILHIADCTASAVKKSGFQKVGLLGTYYTMTADYLKRRLAAHSLSVIVPENDADRRKIQSIINDELSREKFFQSSREFIIQQIHELKKRGAEGVILGCTEIELLVQKQHVPNVSLFRSAQLHIDAAIKVQLGEKKVQDFQPCDGSRFGAQSRFVAASFAVAVTALAACAVAYPGKFEEYVEPAKELCYETSHIIYSFALKAQKEVAPLLTSAGNAFAVAAGRIGSEMKTVAGRFGYVSAK